MNKINSLIWIFCIILLLTQRVNAQTSSSSYLITNAALSIYDYETASNYLNDDQFFDNNIAELNKRLTSFVISNKLEQAVNISKKIIRLDPSFQEAWMVYLTYANLNNENNFFKEFQSLINYRELKIVNQVFYENNLRKKNNKKVAEALFNIIQESNNPNLQNQNRIDHFLFFLVLILNLNPEFNEALFLQAQILQQLKYFDQAEYIYNNISLSHDLYIEAQKNIVANKNKEGKFNEAKNILISLIDLNPQNNSLILLLADLYRINKIYDQAIKYYTKLIIEGDIVDDKLWDIYYMRGICYERLNRWKESENDFQKALAIKPNQPQVLNYLAYGWIERNINFDKSLKMLIIASEKNPENFYILDSLAWAYFKKNNFLMALEIMEKVIKLAPAEAISLDHLGDIYWAVGRKREAYFMWKQAMDLAEPEDEIIDSVQFKLDQFNAG